MDVKKTGSLMRYSKMNEFVTVNKSMIIRSFLVFCCTVVLTWGGLEATQVRRSLEEGKDPVFIDSAEFTLEFDTPSAPQFISADAGRKAALVFQYTVEHRSGVRLSPKYLKPGDVLLEPLVLVSSGEDRRAEMLPAGHVIEEVDLAYILNREYRQFYDASGTQVYPDSFKLGDPLDIYSMTYDDFGQVVFEESGLKSMSGTVIVENGTILKESHLAMLRNATPFPVKVRQDIDMELEFYCRVDWPSEYKPDDRMYWMTRPGVSQPMLLYSYQILPGDKPLADILNIDRDIICEKGQGLELKGERNSIEVLERFTDAKMFSLRGRAITSVDPITKDLNDSDVRPGELVLAPKNRGEFLRPYLVKEPEDLNQMLSNGQLSLSRAFGAKKDEKFPFLAYLTHYTIPFYKDCIAGCDARLDISNDVVKGSHSCKSCNKTIPFRPYVYPEISGYAYTKSIWKESPIHCSQCDLGFMRYRAHALCGEDGAFEYPSMALNSVFSSRLRASRLSSDATLAADVVYYKNGKEITFKEGTLITPELRIELEKRATSPIYLTPPKGDTYEAAQCPRCFAWNHEPLETFSIKGNLTVDQMRRGMATFPYPKGKVSQLELVTFGLSHEAEPTSGRSLAKVITFKKTPGQSGVGDVWEKSSERWAYLPRYSYEKGLVMPVSLTGEEDAGGSIDLLGDDF